MKAIITINLSPPTDCNVEELREWIEYEMGIRSGIRLDNPLEGYQINDGEFHAKVELIK